MQIYQVTELRQIDNKLNNLYNYHSVTLNPVNQKIITRTAFIHELTTPCCFVVHHAIS